MKLKKYSALILIFVLLLMSCNTVWGAAAISQNDYEKGKKGTIFGLTDSLEIGETQKHNFTNAFILNSTEIIDQGAQAVAKRMVASLKAMPEGRRAVFLGPATVLLVCQYAEAHIWWEGGVEYAKQILEPVWSFYKSYGGPDIDYVYADFEHSCNIGTDARAEDIINYESYYADVRQPLIDRGFDMITDSDKHELWNAVHNTYPSRQAVINGEYMATQWTIMQNFLGERTRNYFNDAFYEPLTKYFPNVKFANYDYNAAAEDSIALTQHGYFINNPNGKVGTHSCPVLYGAVIVDHIAGIKALGYDYPYTNFENTPYNSLLATVIWGQQVAKFGPCMTYISSKQYSAADLRSTQTSEDPELWTSLQCNFAHTDYYNEFILHCALTNPDPFLIWYDVPVPSEYIDLLGNLFDEINEVVGFEDRKMITENMADWTKRYTLTGMTANGNNVWRITPDTLVPGVTKKSFLVDKENLIFKVGQDVIDFPEGSFIYEPEEEWGALGYWVISPEGTYPTETKDNSEEIPPVPVFDYVSYRKGLQNGISITSTMDIGKSSSVGSGEGRVNAGLKRTELNSEIMAYLLGNTEKNLFFDDIEGHWAENAITELAKQGLMKGDGKNVYPDSSITKAEFLAIMARVLGTEMDLTGNEWVGKTEAAAKELKLLLEEETLTVDDELVREEMADIIMRVLDADEDTEGVSFTDEAEVTPRYLESVKQVYAKGIINGYPDGNFGAKLLCTRAEAAVIVERIMADKSVL